MKKYELKIFREDEIEVFDCEEDADDRADYLYRVQNCKTSVTEIEVDEE